MSKQVAHGGIGLCHDILLVGLLVTAIFAALAWSECRMENLVERYNRAIDNGNFNEAHCAATIAAALYPQDVVAKQMIWQDGFIRRHHLESREQQPNGCSYSGVEF